MRKAISPTKEQAELMKRAGINFPFLWVVVGQSPKKIVVCNIITGAMKVIDKK